MSERASGGLYPTYRIDLDDLMTSSPWRQEKANQLSDAISKAVMPQGGKPKDVLAILAIAFTDALAVTCVTDPDGYDATAAKIGHRVTERLIAQRRPTEVAMGRQYMLQKPDGVRGDL